MKGTLKGCKMTDYQVPMYERLEPRALFKGGRITDTDILTLSEAARFASVHAGTEITPADILRAGARGEILLAAIVHQRAKVQAPGGGVCINEKHPTDENVIPKGAIPTLPLKACQQLAVAGHASWRTFDGFKNVEGELCRYTKFKLTDDEPDFVTTPDDCRLTGYNVHALADAFIDAPAPEQNTATPAPAPVADSEWVTQAQTRAREIVKESRELDRYPSQENLGDLIASEFRKAGIVGADGKPLTGATIKRHALKGISSAKGKQLSTTIGRGK